MAHDWYANQYTRLERVYNATWRWVIEPIGVENCIMAALLACTAYCWRNEISDIWHPERPAVELHQEVFCGIKNTSIGDVGCDKPPKYIIDILADAKKGRLEHMTFSQDDRVVYERDLDADKAAFSFYLNILVEDEDSHKYTVVVRDDQGNETTRFFRGLATWHRLADDGWRNEQFWKGGRHVARH